MWKFAPPYKLKQLIDLVAQRRYLFSYDGKQYGPMLNVASKEKAKLVRPDEAGPHNSTRDPRGNPPPRTASSSVTPLGWSSTATRF